MGEKGLPQQAGLGVEGVHGVHIHLHWALLGQLSVGEVFIVPHRKLAEICIIHYGLQHDLCGHLLYQGVPHVLQVVVAYNPPFHSGQ